MKLLENKILIISLVIIVGGAIWYVQSNKSNAETERSAPTNLELGAEFSQGSTSAAVKIVQYSDFLCPSCSQVSLGIMPKIVDTFVATGKAHFEFRPMAFIASGSQLAAEGAYCAADQQKFWSFHDAAYEAVWSGYFSKGIDPSQVPLYSLEGVKNIGAQAGLEPAQFDVCVSERKKMSQVQDFTELAQRNGVSGTPYFTINGQPIKGVPTYDILEAAIKAAGG